MVLEKVTAIGRNWVYPKYIHVIFCGEILVALYWLSAALNYAIVLSTKYPVEVGVVFSHSGL